MISCLRSIASLSTKLRQLLAAVQGKESMMKGAGEHGVKAFEEAEVLADWLDDPPPAASAAN